MKPLPEDVMAQLSAKLTEEECGKRALLIFRSATEKVLAKLKQSVVADVTESTKRTVMDLTQKLGDKLMAMAEGWNKEIQDDLIIYPEGTRFVRRRVASQVIVIEQSPRVRTLAFRNNLESGDRESGVSHYSLALPYTVFTLYFSGGNFQKLYVGFRNKPLSRMEDTLGRPNLPNIDNNLSVCMGSEFRQIKWDQKRMAEQVNEVIGTFWQSEFNRDIADEHHRKAKEFPQLANLQTWARSSREDPLFILQIPWSASTSLKTLLDLTGATNPDITKQLQQEVMAVVTTVQTKLTKALEGVEIGTIRPGELSKQFAGVLQDIIKESYADLWKLCDKQLSEEEKRLRSDLDEIVREQLEQLVYFSPYKKARPW
jgi:hypothetical protein